MANALRKFIRKKTQGSQDSDDDSFDDGVDTAPSISQMFADANLYRQAIIQPQEPAFYKASHNQTVQDFAELVGRDLDPSERSLAERHAQLSSDDVSWHLDDKVDGLLTEEPESDEFDESSESSGDTSSLSPLPPSPSPSSVYEQESASQLSPVEIVDLLIEEFGQLAPEGEEKLLLEVDAALIKDVILLVRVLFLSIFRKIVHECGVHVGCGSYHHSSFRISRVFANLPCRSLLPKFGVESRSCSCPPQRTSSETSSVVGIIQRFCIHLQLFTRERPNSPLEECTS